jgi:hypothetical protein
MFQSLLSSPELNDPQDVEAAAMLLEKPAELEYEARKLAEKYAGAPTQNEGQGSGKRPSSRLEKRFVSSVWLNITAIMKGRGVNSRKWGLTCQSSWLILNTRAWIRGIMS